MYAHTHKREAKDRSNDISVSPNLFKPPIINMTITSRVTSDVVVSRLSQRGSGERLNQ